MKDILSKRISVVWLGVCGVAAAVGVVVWLLIAGAPPQNAVLIVPAGGDIGGDRLVSGRAVQGARTPARVGTQQTTLLDSTTLQPAPTVTPALIAVYVSGAVAAPGLYALEPGSRVNDAVQAAGGLLPNADADAINLAARIQDEEHVAVPERAPTPGPGTPPPVRSDTRPPTATHHVKAATPQKSPTPGIVNINTASAQELDTLPMIGPALAQRIIEDRMSNGPFKTIEDLARVSGIGEATLNRLRPHITTGP